jgi:8-oxo-dGTP diphosphatase
VDEETGKDVKLAVYVMVWNLTGKLLVLQRKDTGWEDGKWTVPSGHVEPGESVLAAAARELEEETGLAAPPLPARAVRHVSLRPDAGYTDFLIDAGTTSEVPGNTEPHACSDLRWVTAITDVPLVFGLEEMMQAASRNDFYSELPGG